MSHKGVYARLPKGQWRYPGVFLPACRFRLRSSAFALRATADKSADKSSHEGRAAHVGYARSAETHGASSPRRCHLAKLARAAVIMAALLLFANAALLLTMTPP